MAATAAALARMRVLALHEVAGIPLELVDLFQRLGLTELGTLAGLPATDVLARFGLDGAFAHQLASGIDARPPAATVPPPELAVTQAYDEPVELLGPLVFTAKHLAEELHRRLAERGETCTRLLVEAETEHGERSERQWYRPTGLSAAAMVERVRWQLDGWVSQPGGITGGVVLLRLVPEQAKADAGRQLGFWGEATQADETAVRAIARLTGLLGPEAVTVAEWQGGRHPSERYRWVPAAGADVADLDARREALAPPAQPWPGALAAPSPAWVAATPVPVDVLDVHGHRVGVDARGGLSAPPAMVGGTPVDAWAGPWPADERWWDPARRRRRARFQLLTTTGDALLVSLERGVWWLEARYD
jgi:protein ImuB